ncbi:MAG: signal recognition particle protein [Acidobacteria bacterium]|nr:MAG: signal recognition particle protein [Acidobacteriota bacterium]PYV06683.1 MAG: signal recognition particle protein [Acidobacteriota bacterium]
MFDALQEKFQRVFKTLRVQGVLNEQAVDETLREVRLALLEADVNFKVVKELLDRVRVRALGEEVRASLTPEQEVVRIVRDELVQILGGDTAFLTFSKDYPTVFLLVGLQGSGKTTTAGKLALWLAKKKRRPMLVSTDVYRPAAREQLAIIAKAIQVPCFPGEGLNSPIELALAARKDAADRGHDILIVDTAGRLHIDEELMQEVSELRTRLRPSEVLLVADAMTGQDAVRSAQEFHQRLGTSGVILTKLDGDARGGAALSIHYVTGQPVKFVGVGEKYDALEVFHPDRIVSRILGMGDVLSLIEKAEETIDQKKALEVHRKLQTDTFTLADFRDQLRQVRQIGSVDQMLGMLPKVGIFKDAGKVRMDEKELIHIEAIINSMTPRERSNHEIINGKRRKRIARGSGTSVQQVNQLLRQYVQTSKMMKTLSKGMFGRQLSKLGQKLEARS